MVTEKPKSIKHFRKKLKLTQIQMSSLLGISERNYREKESGKLPFTQTELMEIIMLFDLDTEVFFDMFFKHSFSCPFWINKSSSAIFLNKDKNY